MEIIKRAIAVGAGIFVGMLICVVFFGINVAHAVSVGIFLCVINAVFFYIIESKKQNTAQQTQIDDLKRELEEMKGKMKE